MLVYVVSAFLFEIDTSAVDLPMVDEQVWLLSVHTVVNDRSVPRGYRSSEHSELAPQLRGIVPKQFVVWQIRAQIRLLDWFCVVNWIVLYVRLQFL